MSPAARIALATASIFPGGDEDDARLPEALGGAEFVVWDDPSVDWDAYDLVVIRSTWDYQYDSDAFAAWARGLGRRLVNPPAVVAWNIDKRYLGELEGEGLPVVPTTYVAPNDDPGFRPPEHDYVVKPTVSAGSRDTARFSGGQADAERAAALMREIHASGRTAMVQPYVSSVDERGETALMFFDGTFSHAIHKGPLLRPGEEPTNHVFAPETIQPREPTAAELAVAQRIVTWVARGFGAPPAYARVDLVEDLEGAPHLLELELTEPSLFFAHADGAEQRFAAAIRRRLALR
jgi:glutathione synthase/RimK-type ligase-like ATP-grasp enzyme